MAAVFWIIVSVAWDLATVMLAVFWMAAAFWRMAHTVHTNTHSVHLSTFQPRAAQVPTIFLSHSGKQKPFVEKLYEALQRTNHTAFFDKLNLPKGSPFPPNIFQAVDGCKLGVLVLSDDFITSKWPMLELERLILHKCKEDPDTIVLPLFFKLRTEDLRSEKNLSKWRGVWKENAHKWELAIKALRSYNGEVFIPETSETDYINKVVQVICNLLPSPILSDLSGIHGHDRFAKEVASQFEEVARQRQCDKVCCMVGLYGVGGLGKTTMCEIMCNFYHSKYSGKSCHIEFPSDGDRKKIVQECTKSLRKLANLSDEYLLNNADSFNQVVQLMKDNLRRFDVFLAIDNIVCESSLEAAKKILEVSFSANSKIILTSRSEEVLKDLLRGHISNTTVGPLPSPGRQESFQIFQDTFELGDLNSLVSNRNLLNSVLNRCIFSGKYHALALKALGQYVKRACVPEGLDKIEHILQRIDNSCVVLQNVEDLIRLNYENLAEEKQHMFLDIVVVVMAAASRNNAEVTYENARQWLSFLYKKYSESSTIPKLIYELALDGLIQLDDKSGQKMIRVHDLYSDLAQREAASSARFFIDGSTTSVEKIKWERLERVIVTKRHDGNPCFIEELQQQECQNLRVLCAEGIDFRRGIHLHLMPSLCVLKLERGTLTSIKDWSAAIGLAIVHLSDLEKCAPPLTPIPSMPCLEELLIQNVKTVEGPPDLKGGEHLKTLVLLEASVFKEGEESWEAMSYFNSLTNLESLTIEHFNSLTGVLNLKALVNLRLLDIRSCKSVKRIEGLDALKNLQRLYVRHCPYLSNLNGLSGLLQLATLHVIGGCEALKTMPDLRGLPCLQRLQLRGNKSMEEVVAAGGLSPALKYVEVIGCEALKRMPYLSGLPCLESLELRGNKSMEEVLAVAGGLSPALKYIVVRDCEARKTMPDLSGLTCLKRLQLRGNKSMEEVGGENLSSTLHTLCIDDCRSLLRFPSLNECVHLQDLRASACFINNENIGSFIGNLSNLQKLWLMEGERASIERLMSGSCIENMQELRLVKGDWY